MKKTACGDVILPLTLSAKVGYLKVEGNSEADNHKLTEWQDEYQKWVCYLLTLHGMGPTYRKSGEENVRKQPWLFKKLQNLPFSFKDFTLINK